MTVSHRSWRIRAQQLLPDTLLPNPLVFRCLLLFTLLRHVGKERDVLVLTVFLGKGDCPLPADRVVQVMPVDAIDALMSGHRGQAESELMLLVGCEGKGPVAIGPILRIPRLRLVRHDLQRHLGGSESGKVLQALRDFPLPSRGEHVIERDRLVIQPRISPVTSPD